MGEHVVMGCVPDGVADVGEHGGHLRRELLILVRLSDLLWPVSAMHIGPRGCTGCTLGTFCIFLATKSSEAATARMAMMTVNMGL